MQYVLRQHQNVSILYCFEGDKREKSGILKNNLNVKYENISNININPLLDQIIVISSTVAKMIDRWVSKCLPCKHMEPSSIPSIHVKNSS